jgi:hypothetical protein
MTQSSLDKCLDIQVEMNKSIDKINEVNNSSSLARGTSPIDKRIDEILGYIYFDGLFRIEGDSFSLYLSGKSEGSLSLTLIDNKVLIDPVRKATREDFDIIEGTIGEAQLGDLFIDEEDEDIAPECISIVGFMNETLYSCNYLMESCIKSDLKPLYETGLILRRK